LKSNSSAWAPKPSSPRPMSDTMTRVGRLIDEAVDYFGHLDVAVNVAGTSATANAAVAAADV
jgi:hypothetical protein